MNNTDKLQRQTLKEARLTQDEIDAFESTIDSANKVLALPDLHPMDREELYRAFHVIHNKILARPGLRALGYKEKDTTEPERFNLEDLQGLLGLLGLVLHPAPPLETMKLWTADQCKQAEAWASAVHLHASDNDVQVPPKPDFLYDENANDNNTEKSTIEKF